MGVQNTADTTPEGSTETPPDNPGDTTGTDGETTPDDWANLFPDETPAQIAKRVEESRKWEKRAKDNAKAQEELDRLRTERMSDDEKAAERLRLAEERADRLEREVNIAKIASVAGVPVEVLAGPESNSVEDLSAYATVLSAWKGRNSGPVIPGAEQTPSNETRNKDAEARSILGLDA